MHFVDPISRRTFPSANEIFCQQATQTLFPLEMNNDDSWYNLIPHPVSHTEPSVFSPTRLSRPTLHVPHSFTKAGVYTRKTIVKVGIWVIVEKNLPEKLLVN